jgi:hypothetical protein
MFVTDFAGGADQAQVEFLHCVHPILFRPSGHEDSTALVRGSIGVATPPIMPEPMMTAEAAGFALFATRE